jgi:hypothetical protein
VARQLRARGFDAVALKGGYDAWRAAYPVEPKDATSLLGSTPNMPERGKMNP